jgi:hypothetical protein
VRSGELRQSCVICPSNIGHWRLLDLRFGGGFRRTYPR